MKNKKSLHIINIIIILSTLFIVCSFCTHLLHVIKEEAYFWIKRIILIYSSLCIPFMYFLFQLRCIIKNTQDNKFFSKDTVTRFKKISICIFLINIYSVVHIWHLTSIPHRVSCTGQEPKVVYINYIAKFPLHTIFSTKSPLIPIIVISLLSYIFYLFSTTLKSSIQMKKELDEVI
ncbi:hypothetical protein PV797_10305 [Clostridiaceae bacterium M8S5]|nr:hypothetical protein PV797_10305 [Clostridiaceae bacterium M8S5]